MRVVADIHERPSGVPNLLSELGLLIEVRRLRAGDYHVGGGGLVERKTVRGLHMAITEGTFWRQLGALRRTARIPYLLVEGPDLDEGPLKPERPAPPQRRQPLRRFLACRLSRPGRCYPTLAVSRLWSPRIPESGSECLALVRRVRVR